MTSINSDQSDDTENDNLLNGRFWETLPVPADVLQSLDADFKYQSPKPLQRRVLALILTTPHCSMIVQVSNTAFKNLVKVVCSVLGLAKFQTVVRSLI